MAEEHGGGKPLVMVSTRGPLAFSREASGELVARRGAGGLVSSLGPMVAEHDALWIAAALGDADRAAAERGVVEAEGFRLRLLAIDPAQYRLSYDVICNATLWFLHHHLFDLPRRPSFDQAWREAWDAYREVNAAFADVVVEVAPEGAAVLVQDYHLALLGSALADRRPDLHAVHFTHTPFSGPDTMRVLPDDVGDELLVAMAAYRACGFHTRRWAQAFEASCQERGVTPRTFVAPLAPDAPDLEHVASSEACQQHLEGLDEALAGRQMILRVDRIELSKNLLRGFEAFDQLLDVHPEWHQRVVFVAHVYPSREGLAEYHDYRNDVEALVARVNNRWATPDWTPVLLDLSDDFAASVAALRRYDVLLVNPIRDGLNLVAMEGPVVNEHNGVLLLSREAGAWETMGTSAMAVHPYDVVGMAEVLHSALSMSGDERRDHSEACAKAARSRTPTDWLADQLRAGYTNS